MSSCNFEFLLTEGGRDSDPALLVSTLLLSGSWRQEAAGAGDAVDQGSEPLDLLHWME